MTSTQVVETSVNVISNSPSQDYTHPDDRTLLNDMTPEFKPFTNFDLDGFKSDEEDHENQATDDKQEARWNDQLDNIQVPDFVAATALYFVLDNCNELNIFLSFHRR